MKNIQGQLEVAFKHIDELLSDKNLTDKDTLNALLLVECRALFTNSQMCTWVEESFKLFFKETHVELQKRSEFKEVKESIDDLMSMITLEDKK